MSLKIEDLAENIGYTTEQLMYELKSVGIKRELTENTMLTEEELMSFYNNHVKPLSSLSEIELKAYKRMESIISKSDVIFIDTSSLLSEKSVNFMTHLKRILAKYNKKLILPYKVYEELQKHQRNQKDKKLSSSANSAIKKLVEFQRDNYLEIHGDELLDKFADNVFNTQITRLRIDKSVLLLTNDIGLGQDILFLNESKSVKGKPVRAYKVDRYGFISRIRTVEEQTQPRKPNRTQPLEQNKTVIPKAEKFTLAKEIINYPNEVLPLSEVASSGSSLVTDTGTNVILGKEAGKGGEGSIYITNIPNVVAKIYKREKLRKEKFEKLKLMVSKRLQYEGICYPQNLLFNKRNEFVGYTMPMAKGRELKHFLFIPKKVFENRNPDWTRKDLVQLGITILEKIQFLHNRNIILGDINPFNILVESPTNVYFVDVDSYQVEGFPCPVGTDNYTAPEIQSKNFQTFLRSFGHDYFAIATLLFSILFLGKSPYSQTGGDTNAENIKNMDFPYSYGKEERAENTPKGQWRYIWSNLPFKVKEAFYQTFQKGEPRTEEHSRIATEEWIQIMKRYHDDLSSGRLIKQDEIANDIFPARFKITGDNKKKLAPCRLCKQSFMPWQLNQGICRPCLNKGEDYHCNRCSKELIFTNYEKYIRKMDKRFEYCKDCSAHYRSTYMTNQCTTCYSNFTITYGEKEFFDKKGHNYPKRCLNCRKRARQQQEEQKRLGETVRFTQKPFENNSTSTKQQTDRKKGLCFLTTVACQYYGLPDDCYELETLRLFRDQWLSQQSDGSALIARYYEIAPSIVNAIKSKKEYGNICEMIMHDYILPCVKFIESNKMQECKKHYIQLCENMLELIQQEVVQ